MKKKYVWLNLKTGEFSNSWDDETHADFINEVCGDSRYSSSGYKLIEYTCLNDEDFEFYNQMKLR